MSEYVILTDATCDLTPALVAETGVEVIPMEFTVNGEAYLNWPDGREMSNDDFYNKLRAGATATTAQVNAQTYFDWAKPHLDAGKDVLFLTFSSGLSGSHNSCLLAVEDLREENPGRKILAVDTRAAAMGEGLLVFYAAEQKKLGLSIEELADWATKNRDRLCHWFTVDELSYLHKGGRLSAASAALGTILSIKPLLHVDEDGRLVSVEKVRSRTQSLAAMARRLDETIHPDSHTVFISHADCREDAERLAALIEGTHNIRRIEFGRVGPVIGTHTGPSMLSLFFLGSPK